MISVDCIDCAADESVVNAVNEGINVALSIARVRRPWVMISVNDDREDLHFRKAAALGTIGNLSFAIASLLEKKKKPCVSQVAKFDPEDCPGDCLRPCEKVCPADAILLESSSKGNKSLQSDSSCDKIKVSLPDVGPSTVAVMNAICSIMESHPCRYNLWQLDGRPMSGDIGRGATREAIAFAVRLASTQDKPHERSSETSGAAKLDGSKQALIGGIAYGDRRKGSSQDSDTTWPRAHRGSPGVPFGGSERSLLIVGAC
ncbi:hypothetical protein ACMD2_04729 [Ananas comosus]|uniref:4Fe-4S ferredoxin-type domain-containing protein n=1 Tax=Ananas comosus TaxID=4615 RepID=A0A199UYW3_ANACO|nr:hypothetical protein ACMD2_04729 [Ananas comosus]